MFSFLRKKTKTTDDKKQDDVIVRPEQDSNSAAVDAELSTEKTSVFGRLKERLARTSSKLT